MGNKKRISIGRRLVALFQEIYIVKWQAFLYNEFLQFSYRIWPITFVFSELVKTLSFHILPKVCLLFLLLGGSKTFLLLKFRLQGTFLYFSCRVWRDTSAAEEVQHLTWYFFESLLCKCHGVILEFSEGYELDDVSCHLLFVGFRVKRNFICIQLVHSVKVSIANSYNDY